MPYDVFGGEDDQHCVHKLNPDGSKGKRVDGGCHETLEEAEAHRDALYAAEKEIRKVAEEIYKLLYT